MNWQLSDNSCHCPHLSRCSQTLGGCHRQIAALQLRHCQKHLQRQGHRSSCGTNNTRQGLQCHALWNRRLRPTNKPDDAARTTIPGEVLPSDDQQQQGLGDGGGRGANLLNEEPLSEGQQQQQAGKGWRWGRRWLRAGHGGEPHDSSSGDGSARSGSPGPGSGASDRKRERYSSDMDWGDWDSWDNDWEPRRKAPPPPDRFRRDNPRRGMGTATPRDEYLRPMIDLTGVQYRIGFKESEAEERIETEFETNQWESREAVKFAALLFLIPLATGFVVSRLVANPLLDSVEEANPSAFALSDAQKVEGAHEVHKAELRMRMDAALGRAPPLEGDEMMAQLRHEALELQEEFKKRNRGALLNLICDGITAAGIFAQLLRDTEGRNILYRTIGRVLSGLSDTAKAFMIIAITDILLGYHSEEGWTAAIKLVTKHYGFEVEEAPIYTFVAIVPVTMDALFKYWIFKGLNAKNPAAAVTLKSMDRH